MSQDQSIYIEISTRIKGRVSSLLGLIDSIDETIAKLYNENNLENDLATRIANKGAIDLQNDIIKSQRQTIDLVIEISRDCLELHKHNAKDIANNSKNHNELEKKIQPFIDAKDTTDNIRKFGKWAGGIAVIGSLYAAFIWVIKHIKVIS